MPRKTKIKTEPIRDEFVMPATPPSKTLAFFRQPGTLVFATLFLIASVIAGYFYWEYSETPQVQEKREIARLAKIVGAALDLPTTEIPTLATVTNKERLDNQPFFQRAENGDKILIYSEAGRAVLYRPSTGKIIDLTTVNIEKEQVPDFTRENTTPTPPVESPEASVEASAETEAEEVSPEALSLAVALYNGSRRAGVTNTIEEKLAGEYPNLTIAAKEKAARNNYPNTLVVDLSGTNLSVATALAEFLEGEVGALPPGETAPTGADLLIIVSAQ